VQLFRVYPHLDSATARDRPGHPLFADRALQGFGRFDNPDLYAALYVASTGSAAIGETFQSIRTWTADMLAHPMLPGSERRLATYLFDEDRHQLLDLDDAQTLVEYRLRPTDVVIRNRHVTQRLAAQVWDRHRFAGISLWSNVRPQWQVHVIWNIDALELAGSEELAGHPGLLDANERLYHPPLDPSLR
jgi:RES domain